MVAGVSALAQTEVFYERPRCINNDTGNLVTLISIEACRAPKKRRLVRKSRRGVVKLYVLRVNVRFCLGSCHKRSELLDLGVMTPCRPLLVYAVTARRHDKP